MYLLTATCSFISVINVLLIKKTVLDDFSIDTEIGREDIFEKTSVKNIIEVDELHSSPNKSLSLPLFSERNSTNYKIELIHIPKTGGSALGRSAIEKNVTWGYYNFQKYDDAPFVFDPQDSSRGIPFWHLPLQLFEKIPSEFDVSYYDEDTDVFVVVRNPYERLVSEYRYTMGFNRLQNYTAAYMNQYLLELLQQKPNKDFYIEQGHYIPQYNYVFNGNGRRMVNHILRFDHLIEDFAKLVNLYPKYLKGVKLSSKRKLQNQDRSLSVDDLSKEVLELTEFVYAKDFEYFGFDKITENPN